MNGIGIHGQNGAAGATDQSQRQKYSAYTKYDSTDYQWDFRPTVGSVYPMMLPATPACEPFIQKASVETSYSSRRPCRLQQNEFSITIYAAVSQYHS